MTIAFQSERRRGLFVLQLARAGDYEAATTQKNDEVKKMAFFKKIQNTVKSRLIQNTPPTLVGSLSKKRC